MNGWFTVFISINQNFTQGLTQVLFSMCVIEIAQKGQEAITVNIFIIFSKLFIIIIILIQ